MKISITVDASWLAFPVELAKVLAAVNALEGSREMGGRCIGGDADAADRESLRQFLEGMEDEPPAPAIAPAPTNGNYPDAHHAKNVVKPGKRYFRWLCDQGGNALERATTIGERRGFPSKVVLWSADMVSACCREMERTTEFVNGNGRNGHHNGNGYRRN